MDRQLRRLQILILNSILISDIHILSSHLLWFNIDFKFHIKIDLGINISDLKLTWIATIVIDVILIFVISSLDYLRLAILKDLIRSLSFR
jgi:hypothetical protein